MEEEQQPLISPSIETNTDRFKKVQVTDEDKERFFKSILTDKPYEETVPLFNNQIKVKFRSMTVQENSDVVKQISEDKKNGIASDTDAYFITISTYRLGLSLVSIDDKVYSNVNRDNFTALKDDDSYVLARARPMLSWATPRLSAFLDAFSVFENKVLQLTQEVQNPNFWKAST